MTKKKASKKSKASKAKAKAAAPAKSLPQGSDIPEGMQQIGGGFAPTWKPEIGESLHGTISGGVRDVELTIGRKKQTRRCLEFTTKDGDKFTIWESAALGDFFDTVSENGEGGEYFIRFDGYGRKKAGQNPPKLFTVAGSA